MQLLDEIYVNDVYGEMLLEGKIDRIMQMFAKFPELNEYYPIKSYARNAIDILKKDDRITYMMAWYRLHMLVAIKQRGNMHMTAEKLETYIKNCDALISEMSRKSGVPTAAIESVAINFDFNYTLSKLRAFYDAHIHEIDSREFKFNVLPSTIIQEFDVIYSEWKKQFGSTLVQAPTDEVVMKFPNGWVWVNVHTNACSREEKEILRHCGNDQNIYKRGNQEEYPWQEDMYFSLREPIIFQGEQRWRPHVSAIINKNGNTLRESKGMANSKPKEYYNYLIALVKSPYVGRIDTLGGYGMENSFHLTDTPKAVQEEIEKIKGENFEIKPTDKHVELLQKIAEKYNRKLKHTVITVGVEKIRGARFYHDLATFDITFTLDLDNLEMKALDENANDNESAKFDRIKSRVAGTLTKTYWRVDNSATDVVINGKQIIVKLHSPNEMRSSWNQITKGYEAVALKLFRLEKTMYPALKEHIINELISAGLVLPKDATSIVKTIFKDYSHVHIDDPVHCSVSIWFILRIPYDQIPENVRGKMELKREKIWEKLSGKGLIEKIIRKSSGISNLPDSQLFNSVGIQLSYRDANMVKDPNAKGTLLPAHYVFRANFRMEAINNLPPKTQEAIMSVLEYMNTNYASLRRTIYDIVNMEIGEAINIPTPEESNAPKGQTPEAYKKWYMNQLRKKYRARQQQLA